MYRNTAIKLIPNLASWATVDVIDVRILNKEEVLELFDAIDADGLNDIEIASLCLTAISLLEEEGDSD
jgi:hypothetical protein